MPVHKLFADDLETALLSNSIALHAVRNPLEDLHAGTFPDTKVGDYSDVKVVTPYGEIPWNNLSRISDREMKALMIEVTSTLFSIMANLEDNFVRFALMITASDCVSKWNAPAVDEEFLWYLMNPRVVSDAQAKIGQEIYETMRECKKARLGKKAGLAARH